MATALETVEGLEGDYKYGFVTDIEAEDHGEGSERRDRSGDLRRRRTIPEWLTEWRLQALERFFQMEEPDWAKVEYPPIDFTRSAISQRPSRWKIAPKSLDEVDPELLRTYEKLGIPVREQEILAGVAVDYVFDSVSVATTFKEKLSELGIIFCSISEAVQDHPGAGQEISRHGRAAGRQLLRRPELGRLLGWHLRLRAERACARRWSCPPISASMPRIPASSSAR